MERAPRAPVMAKRKVIPVFEKVKKEGKNMQRNRKKVVPKREAVQRSAVNPESPRAVVWFQSPVKYKVDIVAARVLDELGVDFDVFVFSHLVVENEYVQEMLKLPHLKEVVVLPNYALRDYNVLKKGTGAKDLRGVITESLVKSRQKIVKSIPEKLGLLERAACIWVGYRVDAGPFMENLWHKTVAWNALGFVQVPQVEVDGAYSTCHTVGIGHLLGFSQHALDEGYLTSLLESRGLYSPSRLARGEKLRRYILQGGGTTCSVKKGEAQAPKVFVDGVEKDYGVIWDQNKSVFVPLHCNWDEQLTRRSPLWGTNLDFLKDVVEAVPDDFKVIVKVHPFQDFIDMKEKDAAEDYALHCPKCIVVKHDVNEIIPTVKGVAVINSSVGLEAVVHYKPVVVGGYAFFAHIPNVTRAAYYNRACFKQAVKEMCLGSGKVDERMCLSAIQYFWDEWMVPTHPQEKFKERVKELFVEVLNKRKNIGSK